MRRCLGLARSRRAGRRLRLAEQRDRLEQREAARRRRRAAGASAASPIQARFAARRRLQCHRSEREMARCARPRAGGPARRRPRRRHARQRSRSSSGPTAPAWTADSTTFAVGTSVRADLRLGRVRPQDVRPHRRPPGAGDARSRSRPTAGSSPALYGARGWGLGYGRRASSAHPDTAHGAPRVGPPAVSAQDGGAS